MNEPTTAVEPRFATPVYERLPPRVWWLGGLMVAIGVVTFFLMSTRGENGGYWYLLFYSIPANTAISLFPHEPVLMYYGTFADLWVSAAAAAAGTVIAGWLDHRVFVPVLSYRKISSYKQSRFYQASTRLFMRYPFATLMVTGFTPIPFWPFKFLCFSIQYPLWRYLAALGAGRYPRYVVLAWVGAEFGIPTWILIAAVIVVFALYAIRGIPTLWRLARRRRLRDVAGQDEYPARSEGGGG